MKTAKEFAEMADRTMSDEGYLGIDCVELLLPIFEHALDQSLQWKDGPPKEDGRWLCVLPDIDHRREYRVDGDKLFFGERSDIQSTHRREEVIRHFGPIPEEN